jgi:hypothetical protein
MLECLVKMLNVEHSLTDMQLYSIRKEINLMFPCHQLFQMHKSNASRSVTHIFLSMQCLGTSMVMLSHILTLSQFGKLSLVILQMAPKLL